ncbi:MAG: hypothetical protein AVDCRST_MAG61-760 [uncultured Friedmanniella sp.]|uniref:Endonuclease/exonuclease/phosphatase domain-containing protein n=1 Tax=uncultured Friedmanniella sp. TaxID=335381 RepID=A0A6J4K6E8_9ACTN|nr:endonuclease/exonuclease/phosphatase family protein [uncultured Friedmanniella sp.]CAA9296722.1 MAG: hypothetical protein AVDCRST_MAG61-760 [uncultured Friedmanniella sp.]
MRFPSSKPARPAVAAGLPLTGLVAVLTLVTLELVRSSGPLLDTVYSAGGASGASRAAALTYAGPGAVVALLLLVGGSPPRRTARVLLLGTGLLAVLRLLVQGLDGGVRVVWGFATVAVAVAVLCVAVSALSGRPGGGRAAAAALLTGAAGAVGLQLALGTWDAYWRHTPLGWTVTLVTAVAVVVLAGLAARQPSLSPTLSGGRVWAIGPWLALTVMMLANPAFAAAQAGVPLALAGPLHGLGLLLAVALVARAPLTGHGLALLVAALAGLVGLVLVALLVPAGSTVRSAVVLAAIMGAQLSAALLLARALTPVSSADRVGAAAGVPLRLAAMAAVAGLATIGPVLVHQLHYTVPLGFPHDLVLAVTAAVLGAGALHRREAPSGAHLAGRPVLVCAAGLLLAGSAVAAMAAGSGTSAADPSPTNRVMSWNLHFGVGPDGAVDLESIARTIEAHDPDVLLLQEVSRGWVQGGGTDMATWLSQRLDRPFVFGAAADGRFGNAVLARRELSDAEVLALPFGAGPQQRSAVSARTEVGGVPMTVTSIHLQHRPANSGTRVRQVQTFLDSAPLAPGGPARILGGDLNATPGTPEVALLIGAGFVSAVDAVGDPRQLTDPSRAPTRRIDWVFGRGVGFSDARVLTGVTLSDHLPLVVTIAP